MYIGTLLVDIWFQNDIPPDIGPFGCYCTECAQIPLQPEISRNFRNLQKFPRYRRYFQIIISGIKFQTYFTFIIFLYISRIMVRYPPPSQTHLITTFRIRLLYQAMTKGGNQLRVYFGGAHPNFPNMIRPSKAHYISRMSWRMRI